MAILKKNVSIRLCGDYKSTVNQVPQWETFLFPTTDLLYAKLAGCQKFSQLYLELA